jgi:hypothetical protein
MEKVYCYNPTLDKDYWKEQLKKVGKRMTPNDHKLFRRVRTEKENNNAISRIHKRALDDDLYIPCLTELHGDCMFESLEHIGFCSDRNVMRQSIGILFFLFGDHKIIPSNDLTLKELFDLTNEIQYVFCDNTCKLYQYTYNTMCVDMFSNGSWSRLPTELVMLVFSVFFKVRFHVYHDNGYVNKICDTTVDRMVGLDCIDSNIYLGLIGEHHYVPLVRRVGKLSETKCPRYTDQATKFHEWAMKKADTIGLYRMVCKETDRKIDDIQYMSCSESDADQPDEYEQLPEEYMFDDHQPDKQTGMPKLF